jgi:hypothetical protein
VFVVASGTSSATNATRNRSDGCARIRDPAAYPPSMALAVVWHFWIGLFLVFAAVLLVPAIVVGYLNKVVRPRYPSRAQRELQDQ